MAKGANIMTKEEYLYWLKTRPEDASQWHIKDCRGADNLIRETTIANFHRWAIVNIKHSDARLFFEQMIAIHFGSVETDNLLIKLDCYPDWMEKARWPKE